MANNAGHFATFDADDVALGVVLDTIEQKTLLIPGVTCNSQSSGRIPGETAYFYDDAQIAVKDGSAGDQVTFNANGGHKKTIVLDKQLSIGERIPAVSYENITADIVGTYAGVAAKKVANARSFKAVTAMSEGGTDSTETSPISTGQEALDAIAKEFELYTKANPESEAPTALIITPELFTALYKLPQFMLLPNYTEKVLQGGEVGQLLGMRVVLCPKWDAPSHGKGVPMFVMLNEKAFCAPYSLNSMRVVDGTVTGYIDSAIIAGHLVYGFLVAKKNLIRVRRLAA